MILRIIEVHAADISNRQEFNAGVRFLVDLYESCLEKVRTESIAKVIIQFAADYDMELDKIDNPLLSTWPLGNVLFVAIPFAFEIYWKSDANTRARMTLDGIQAGLLKFAKAAELSSEPFENAYRAVLSKNCKNEGFWQKPKFNPSRTLKANIRYAFYAWQIDMYVNVYDAQGREVSVVPFTAFAPHAGFLYGSLGKFEWIDDDTVQLTAKDTFRSWRMNVSEMMKKYPKMV
jgi:hypothetical protein